MAEEDPKFAMQHGSRGIVVSDYGAFIYLDRRGGWKSNLPV
jgi:hypothetical protein